MSNLFGTFSNEVDDTLNATAAPGDEIAVECVKNSVLNRKQEKLMKKLHKLLKKNRKLLKEAKKERNLEKNSEKKSEKKSDSGEVKVFLKEVGKAVCKAVPAILTSLASAAIGFLFRKKTNERAYAI